MKKFISLFLTLILIICIFAACDKSEAKDTESSAEATSADTVADTSAVTSADTEAAKSVVMRAKIIELAEKTALVEPVEDDPARRSADRIYTNIDGFNDIGAKVGSIVDITYDGYIMETYPAQIRASAWSKVSDPATSDPISKTIEVGSIAKLGEMREMSVCNDEATLDQYLQSIASTGIEHKAELIAFVNLIDSLPHLSVLDGNITRICASHGISEDTGEKTDVVFITTEAENGDWTRVEYVTSVTNVAEKIADEKASVSEKSLLSEPIESADGKLTIHIETREPHPSDNGTIIQWVGEIDSIFTRIFYYSDNAGEIKAENVIGKMFIFEYT